jgi:hypothetical protein
MRLETLFSEASNMVTDGLSSEAPGTSNSSTSGTITGKSSGNIIDEPSGEVCVDSFRNASSDLSGRATGVLSRNVTDGVSDESFFKAPDRSSAYNTEEVPANAAGEVFGSTGASELAAGEVLDKDFGKGSSGKMWGAVTGEVITSVTGKALGMPFGRVAGAVTGEAFDRATGQPSGKDFGKGSCQLSILTAEGITTKNSRTCHQKRESAKT